MLGFFLSVDELDSLEDVGQDVGTTQRSPFFLRGLHQLVDHGQAGHSAAAALGFLGSQTHGGERTLDRIGRTHVLPVFGGEIAEGQEHVAILVRHSAAWGYLAW